ASRAERRRQDHRQAGTDHSRPAIARENRGHEKEPALSPGNRGVNEMPEPGSDLVLIARAVKTHGLKGEVAAELLTDFPERFEDLDEVVLVSPGGEQKTVSIEEFWFQRDRVVLKIDGYDDVDAAKELIGYEFAVPESDRVELDTDEFY